MAPKQDIKIWQQHLQDEREAIWLYQAMADGEPNKELASIYLRLVETESRHARVWEGKLQDAGVVVPPFKPGFRTRMLHRMARKNGAAAVVPLVAAMEGQSAGAYGKRTAVDPETRLMEQEEASHARVFGYLARTGSGVGGADLARFEGRHKSGGNALRAGVLGANDGLVSIFCLVMGVAGAGVAQREILITGGAGLIAGALSMALGEWLSVQSARELYENQMKVEARELEELPEEEKEELALIYQAKGLDAESARKLADKLLGDKQTALDTLAREELGINPEELGGSAWEAAGTSFLLFAIGGAIPVLPYLFWTGAVGVLASGIAGTMGLFALGAVSSYMSGAGFWKSSLRQVLIGLITAGITFGIGHLIGVAV